MSKKKPKHTKKKYLVDTSLVPAALGWSTAEHNGYFADEAADGGLAATLYVRMEFIRRWTCLTILFALTVDQFGDVANALAHLEQDFSSRNLKSYISSIQRHLRLCGALGNTRAAAEELALQAVLELKEFDRVFKDRFANKSRCQIGDMVPEIDCDNLLESVRVFYEEFRKPVEDCGVNGFLDLQSPRSPTLPMREDEEAAELPVVQQLSGFASNKTWITCTQCAKIGDAVIALEQPGTCTLISSDRAFATLCHYCGRESKIVLSERGLAAAADREEETIENAEEGEIAD